MTSFDAQAFFAQRDREEAERAFPKGSLRADGVFRWDSNDQCPAADLTGQFVALGLITAETKVLTDAARQVDTAAFLDQYRTAQANRTPEDLAEERFEMLAAFGPGETVVNVVTGERTHL